MVATAVHMATLCAATTAAPTVDFLLKATNKKQPTPSPWVATWKVIPPHPHDNLRQEMN